MPEQRGREHHLERLSQSLREEIGALLEGELGDPRIGLATVSEVQLAPDRKSARVFVMAQGDERQVGETLAGLAAAKGYIRHELAERLRLRRVPDLVFQLDTSEQHAARIDQLLQRVKSPKR